MKKIKLFFKNKYAASLFLGAICSLAFAPFHFFLVGAISLSGFYLLLEKIEAKKSVFWLGFAYGFGYFLTGVYWIAISLLVDAEKFAWLIPFALTLIPAALALYVAIFALSYKFFIKKFRPLFTYQKILIFALCWLFFEILRATLFTGFPWNLLGYIWMFDVNFAQAGNVFGIYGLSVLAVLTCLFPALFFTKRTLGDKIFAVIIAVFFVGNFIYGYCSIDEKKLVHDHKTTIRLVQGNVEQEMKWNLQQKYRNFLKHIELTNSRSLEGINSVIWSETSVPYIFDSNPQLLEKLKLATPINGTLITGGLRIEGSEDDLRNVWNSVFALDWNGVFATYDKHHLVPFGEYVPLQKYFPFINKITEGAVGFSQGEGAKTIKTPNFSFSPLLCYEVIFSGEISDKKNRPDLLVNLTNDAWFGVSSGPYQHFDMARMRSIESGISLARVANTGITAFIDPFGRVVDRINLNQSGIIDVDLVKNLAPTIYEKYSYKPLVLLVLAILLFLIFTPKRHNVTRQNHTN